VSAASAIVARLMRQSLAAEESAWLDRLAGNARLADAAEAHADALWGHAEAWRAPVNTAALARMSRARREATTAECEWCVGSGHGAGPDACHHCNGAGRVSA
jgi:hypothetical protein